MEGMIMGVKVREKPKGSGEWWIVIDHKGKRKSKKVGTDKRVALQVAKQVEAKLVLGDLGVMNKKDNGVPLFKDYSALWLENYVKGVLRPSTFERYDGLLKKYILPEIGSTPLDQIKRSDVRNLLMNVNKEGQSKSSVALIRNVISSLMNHAMDEELIQANPVIGILKQLRMNNTKRITIEPMNPDEVSLVLSTCQEECLAFYPFFLTAFRTGMRLGELLGLHWGDIDWNSRFIKVRRSYKRGHTGPTKNGKERRVDMSNQLMSEMKRLYLVHKEKALSEGKIADENDLVFSQNNKQIEQNDIRRVFNRILRRAGIRHMRVHDIRHTYASLLLSNGYSLMYVKEQMGHHSIQVTVDTYGHLIPNGNRDAVNSLDEIYSTAILRNPDATSRNNKAVNY
jgi:integrase